MTARKMPSLAVSIEHAIRDIAAQIARMACVAPPVLRIALALPFFRSGLTRWAGFLSLSPSAAYLFEEEFKLHVFSRLYDLPAPIVTAHFVITLPILVVLGFATRFVALGLLIMTGMIQLVAPDGWANFHLYWAALALAIIALGPRRLSLDDVIQDQLFRSSRSILRDAYSLDRFVGSQLKASLQAESPSSTTLSPRDRVLTLTLVWKAVTEQFFGSPLAVIASGNE